MKPNLTEAFVITRATTSNGKNIAIVDPKKPENKRSFEFREIFKNNGANWDNYNKYWFWWLSDDPKKTEWILNTKIKPALEQVHNAEGASPEESSASLIASIDSLINTVKTATVPAEGDSNTASASEKDDILTRLDKFKQRIVNLENDEEFKKTMKAIIDFKNSQGHQISFINTLLVWIQKSDATMTKSKSNWFYVNREVLPTATRIMIWSPAKNAMIKPSKDESNVITQSFLTRNNVRKVSDLPVGEQEKLRIRLRGTLGRRAFDLVIHYDISDTKVMEGKEDKVNYEEYKKIKWFDDKQLDDRVKPIYNALLSFAQENGIKVDLSDKIHGDARGVSKNGSIEILQNEGNDVGLTKTLAHEISHEILHQSYLKDTNDKFKDYFVGTTEGRGLVEQQAELSAWMVMAQYGFDLVTAFNYVAMWGANPDGMIKVFDTVARTVNMLLNYIDTHIKGNVQEIEESTSEHHVDAMDVARALGVEKQFNNVLANNQKKQSFNESFYRLVNKQ